MGGYCFKTFEFLNVNIPSFGGNWKQEFHIKTNWTNNHESNNVYIGNFTIFLFAYS